MSETRRDPPDELDAFTAEESWTIEGPNSGGEAGWWLYQGYMHWFHNEGRSGTIRRGIPVEEWVSSYADTHPEIVEVLRARDAGSP